MNTWKLHCKTSSNKRISGLLYCLCLLTLLSMSSPSALAETISLSSSSYSVNEGSGSLSVAVNLQSDSFSSCPLGECYDAVRVTYATSNGTATAGSDYNSASGTLTWTVNSPQTQTIPLSIINDTQVEPNETFNISISNCQEITFNPNGDTVSPCSSSSIISPSSASVTIVNDDVASTVGLDSASLSVNENDGSATVTATRSGSLNGPASVNYNTSSGTATSGEDYTAVSGVLTWADGEGGSKSIVIPIINDTLVENPETFNLTLSSPSDSLVLGQSDSNITILSDDSAGTVSWDNLSYTVNEKGGSLTVTASRSDGTGGAVTVEYTTSNGTATAGQDYTATSGILSWADGEGGSKSVSIPIIADSLEELDETFTLSLSNPTNNLTLSQSDATVTIVNDTSPGTIAFETLSLNVAEGNQAILTVIRTGGGDGPVTVDFATQNGTASSGEDYNAQTGTLSWGDQDTAPKTISITTLKDSTLNEPDESFTVHLSNVTGQATLADAVSATVTVTDATEALSDIPNLTPNQKSLAGALDKACAGGAAGEFLQLCNDLYTSGNPIQILDAIIPEQIAAQGASAIEFGYLQMKFLHGRIVSLRNKNTNQQFNILGFNVDVNGNNVPMDKFSQLASNALYGGAASADEEEPFRDSPLGFFLKGQINIGDRDGTGRTKGYDIETKGVTFGADYRFTDELVMGLALGYGHTNNDFNNNQGDMITESGDFSLYGSYFLPKDYYMDWILSYTINSYDMERKISYSGFASNAISHPEGSQSGFSLGFGKDFYYQNLYFSPYTRIEYLNTSIDSYSERALGGVALAVQEQTIESVMSTIGGQLSQALSMPWGILSPGIRAEWVHQFKYNDREINARFIDAPVGTGQFTILTDSPDRNYFNLGASIAATLPEGRSAFFRYETRVGQDRVSSHTLELGVRLPF